MEDSPSDDEYHHTRGAKLLDSVIRWDDPAAAPWEQSFLESLLVAPPPPPPPYSSNSGSTPEGFGMQTTFTPISSNENSDQITLLSSADEKASFMASLGLGVEPTPTLPSGISSFLEVESLAVENGSWNEEEDRILRAAMAENMFVQPIPWQSIARALPWKPSPTLEVLNRANQWLQGIQQQVIADLASKGKKKRKVPIRWTEEEHNSFLHGIQMYGWGKWKKIADLIPTRTVSQITSHSQKYQNPNKRNRRNP